MSAKYGSTMDQKDMVRLLIDTVDSFSQDRLIYKEQRTQQKEHCAERLAAEDGSCDKETEVRYSEQAVLANLDWGIEALEEVINNTSNMETKLARLDYAEKMLQVCTMLNSAQETVGVPNFYLSAWAHLNLSYLWKLRSNIHNSVLHVLEMFIVDPFFSRIDFAPELWKDLFLPQMSSIVVGWYSEERYRLMMEAIPDCSDLSLTADLDQFFNESLIFSLRPDQMEKLQKLEKIYGEVLDGNRRLFAKYYKDLMNSDLSSNKRVIPMLPIAEPPMTPLHEISRSIPDYVKFGPILPNSAGFSAILKSKNGAREARSNLASSRKNASSITTQILESARWEPQDGSLDENEDESEHEPDDGYADCEDTSTKRLHLRGVKMVDDTEAGPKALPSKIKNQVHSSSIFSPLDSPRTTPKILSINGDEHCEKEPVSMLQLYSNLIKGSAVDTPLPESLHTGNDYSISSAGSDGEVMENLWPHTDNES